MSWLSQRWCTLLVLIDSSCAPADGNGYTERAAHHTNLTNLQILTPVDLTVLPERVPSGEHLPPAPAGRGSLLGVSDEV